MRKIFFILFIFLILPITFSQTSWKNYAGNISNNPQIANFDISFLNYGYTLIPNSSSSSVRNDVLIGNLDENINTKEVMVFSNPTSAYLTIFNLTGSIIYHSYFGDYYVRYSYILEDFDNDGIDEIFVIFQNKTFSEGYVTTIKYNVNTKTWYVSKNLKISSSFNFKTPVCYGGYCYFQDDYGKIYKYNPSINQVISTLNFGNVQNSYLYRLTIDNCVQTMSSPQLVAIFDNEDTDNYWNNYAIIPINTFDKSNSLVINTTLKNHIEEKIKCQNFQNENYLFSMQITIVPEAYNTFNLYKSNSSGVFFINQTIFNTYGAYDDYPNRVSDISVLDYNNDNQPEFCLFYNNGEGKKLFWECYNITFKLIYRLSLGDTPSALPIYTTTNILADINNNGFVDIMSYGKYAYEPLTRSVSLYSPLIYSTQKAFINLGYLCSNYYTFYNNSLFYAISSAYTCNYFFEENQTTNNRPVITSSNYSHTTYLDIDDTLYASIYGNDAESDTLCWAYTCDYNNEIIQSGRAVEEYFNQNETAQYLRIRMNAYDPYNCSYNTYLEDGVIGYVFNISNFCTIPAEFWLNTTTSGSGLDYNTMKVNFVGGFNANNMIIHAGLKTSLSVPNSPLSTLLSNAYYIIGYARNGSNEYIYRVDNSGIFQQLYTSSTIYDRIQVELDWDLAKYRVKVDSNFDGNFDYTSSWYNFLNTGGKLKTLYFVGGENELYNGKSYNSIIFQSYVEDLSGKNPAFLDTLYLEYNDTSSISFNCNNANPFTFTCNYNTLGSKVIRTWLTDAYHNDLEVYTTKNIIVVEEQEQNATCEGFTPDSCTGSCWFKDTFSYSNPLSCAGWGGTMAFDTPINNQMQIKNLSSWEYGIYIDKNYSNSILYNNWYSFRVSFDIKLNSGNQIIFSIPNQQFSKYALYLIINNYVMTAYTSSDSISLTTLSSNTFYNLKFIINFFENKIYYYLNNEKIGETTLYDEDVVSARGFYIDWLNIQNMDVTIDNFEITLLEPNPNQQNQTTTYTSVSYTFNPDMFCAINWSSNEVGKRFSKENCAERGFDTSSSLIGLCIPRACIQDFFSLLYIKATKDLFVTIIVVTMIILFAPILIILVKKR